MLHSLNEVNRIINDCVFHFWDDDILLLTRCAIGSFLEGEDGGFLNGTFRVGGCVLFSTIGTSELDSVAAPRHRPVIASFDAPLVSTPLGFSEVGAGADGADWELILAQLGRMKKLAAFVTMGDGG